MVEKKFELVWTSRSQKNIKALYDYISTDSAQNAKKVINDIMFRIEKAIHNPEIYAPDKYKINNDGSYRAFEIHKYRIAYRVTGNVIRILKIQHTQKDLKPY